MTAPTRIGRYEIVRRIGKSMTEVYLAIDTVENRQAVLKLVKIGADRVTQLVLEAERRGAAIQKELHAIDPRMVEIYEFGDLDGYFFVAMQYVEGRSLAEVLGREHTIDPLRAAAIALEICEQLAKFHSWQSPWYTAISSRPTFIWGLTTRCGCWISASPNGCGRIAT